jgi:hypothetical protein
MSVTQGGRQVDVADVVVLQLQTPTKFCLARLGRDHSLPLARQGCDALPTEPSSHANVNVDLG